MKRGGATKAEIEAARHALRTLPMGPSTGEGKDGERFYSRADAIRDGRPMIYQDREGRMQVTYTA